MKPEAPPAARGPRIGVVAAPLLEYDRCARLHLFTRVGREQVRHDLEEPGVASSERAARRRHHGLALGGAASARRRRSASGWRTAGPSRWRPPGGAGPPPSPPLVAGARHRELRPPRSASSAARASVSLASSACRDTILWVASSRWRDEGSEAARVSAAWAAFRSARAEPRAARGGGDRPPPPRPRERASRGTAAAGRKVARPSRLDGRVAGLQLDAEHAPGHRCRDDEPVAPRRGVSPSSSTVTRERSRVAGASYTGAAEAEKPTASRAAAEREAARSLRGSGGDGGGSMTLLPGLRTATRSRWSSRGVTARPESAAARDDGEDEPAPRSARDHEGQAGRSRSGSSWSRTLASPQPMKRPGGMATSVRRAEVRPAEIREILLDGEPQDAQAGSAPGSSPRARMRARVVRRRPKAMMTAKDT